MHGLGPGAAAGDEGPEAVGVSARDGTMLTLPVGVGKNGTPFMLPIRDGMLINDKETLTILWSDGSKFIRRRGQILELCNVEAQVAWAQNLVVKERTEERLGTKRLYTFTFAGGGTCSFLERADGITTQLFAENVEIDVRGKTIEIYGTCMRGFEC